MRAVVSENKKDFRLQYLELCKHSLDHAKSARRFAIVRIAAVAGPRSEPVDLVHHGKLLGALLYPPGVGSR